MYFKVLASEYLGKVQVMYSMYLEPGDTGYEKCRIYKPVWPEEGYARQAELHAASLAWASYSTKYVTKEGIVELPKDYEMVKEFKEYQQEKAAYDAWYAALPLGYQDVPFHNYFAYFEASDTNEEILFVGELAATDAYTKWSQNKFPGVESLAITFAPTSEKSSTSKTRASELMSAKMVKKCQLIQ